MHFPTPCSRCNEIVELDEMNFRTPFCECRPDQCSHGVCDECKRELEEEAENQ